MKILLVGEFSGFFTALKHGLQELGHEVRTLSGGDSWKGFPADWPLYSRRTGLRGKLSRNVLLPIRGLANAARFRADVVQFINPLVLAPRVGLLPINRRYFLSLMSMADRSYLVCAGDDAVYWRTADSLPYSPKRDQLHIDFSGQEPESVGQAALRWNEELARRVNGIIPIAFDYALGYRSYPNLRRTIPLPFLPLDAKPHSLDFSGRLRVYHGITRPGFKGSRYILDAFDALRESHGDVFDFVVAEAKPYQQYVKDLAEIHVLVDQTNSYSYGMNALLGMAAGKVVLSGAEPQALKELEAADCPIINIKPSADSVRNALLALAADRSRSAAISSAGPKFVQERHHPRLIAARYLQEWAV